jgi:hypothetical protein
MICLTYRYAMEGIRDDFLRVVPSPYAFLFALDGANSRDITIKP